MSVNLDPSFNQLQITLSADDEHFSARELSRNVVSVMDLLDDVQNTADPRYALMKRVDDRAKENEEFYPEDCESIRVFCAAFFKRVEGRAQGPIKKVDLIIYEKYPELAVSIDDLLEMYKTPTPPVPDRISF